MNANITRHAYVDHTGKSYMDSVGTPIAVKPYQPLATQAGHRTIIRNNHSDILPALPNSDCGCSVPSRPAILTPAVPGAFPRHAPLSSPKYAPAASIPQSQRPPAFAPRPLAAPIIRPATAAAPPVVGDNGHWAANVRKDNLFMKYAARS